MIRRILHIFCLWPRTTLCLWLLLTAAVGAGGLRLKFDFSPESVYSGQDEAVAFCEQHKRLFRFEDSVCLFVLQSTDGSSLLRHDCLDWLQSAATAAQQVAGVRKVSSLLTLERPVVRLEQAAADPSAALRWVPLFAAADLQSSETIQDRIARLPLLNDLLISRDQTLLLMLVDLDPAEREIGRLTTAVTALQAAIGRTPPPAQTRLHLSGVPPIRVDIIRSLRNDQLVMVPITTGLFFVLSLLMFRSLGITLLALLGVISPVALTVGVMGWSGQPFNLLSNIVPPMSLIIAAANTVHIVSRFRHALAGHPRDTSNVVLDVMSEMAVTCFLTLVTTAVGFGSLWLARSTLLQALALQAMLAMLFTYVSLMLVLTCGLSLLGHLLQPHQRDHRIARLQRRMEVCGALFVRWLGSAIVRHPATIVGVTLLFVCTALVWASDTRVNSMMFETYEARHPVMQTIQLLDQQLSGVVSLELQLRAPTQADFFRHDTAVAVRRLRQEMEADPRITFTRDYTQILEAFDSRLTAASADTATAAWGRVQRLLQRVDVSRVTRDFLAVDEPAARVMLRVHDIGSAGLKELVEDIRRKAEQLLPDDVECHITGDAALHAVCMDVFVRDLFVSLVSASGIIFALIALQFRSLRIGLMSAIPNLTPLVLTLAWMKLRGLELNAGNVIVFAISLGIAVDDTIHFLARFREIHRVVPDRSMAVRRTVTDCGRAIVLTSILIVLGLSALIFSEFVPTRRFAELTAVTMASALLGDLVLLPALLALQPGRRRERPAAAAG